MADTRQSAFVGETPTGETLRLLTPDKYAQLQDHCKELQFLVGKAHQPTPTREALRLLTSYNPAPLPVPGEQPQLSQAGESPQLASDNENQMMETITKLSDMEGLVVSVGKTMTGAVVSGLGFLAGGLVGGRYGAMLG